MNRQQSGTTGGPPKSVVELIQRLALNNRDAHPSSVRYVETTRQAARVHAQAAYQSEPFLPYTGTAELTYHQLDRESAAPEYRRSMLAGLSMLPPQASTYDDVRQVRIHFAVRDLAHFRVDVQTIAPALEAGARTIVRNGSSMLIYDTRTETASTFPVPLTPEGQAMNFLPLLMAGDDLRGYGPLQFVALPNPAQSLDSYLAELRQDPTQGVPSRTARLVGQDTLLGRTADVIDYGPLFGSGSGSFGTARLWVDPAHPFLLQVEVQFSPQEDTHAGFPNDVLYRVTDLTLGTGPSDGDLQVEPPVNVVRLDRDPGTAGGNQNGGAMVPSPFLNIPTLDPSVMAVSCDPWSWQAEGPLYGAQAVEQIFTPDRSGCATPPGNGPYVLVQQRVQVHGLPSPLQVGQPRTIAGCQIWSGSYPDGQLWAAFAMGQISILVTTNTLSSEQLLTYVGADLCTAPVSTASPTPPGILPPTVWWCVAGEPKHWSITVYNYRQRGQSCYHYLDQAVDSLPKSVQVIIPPGGTGSVDTSTCSITGSAADDPPGGVYFVRCPQKGGRGWAAGWSGEPTDGPAPIKPSNSNWRRGP